MWEHLNLRREQEGVGKGKKLSSQVFLGYLLGKHLAFSRANRNLRRVNLEDSQIRREEIAQLR